MKFGKNGNVKVLDDESKLISFLLADGWEQIDEKPKKSKKDKEELKNDDSAADN